MTILDFGKIRSGQEGLVSLIVYAEDYESSRSRHNKEMLLREMTCIVQESIFPALLMPNNPAYSGVFIYWAGITVPQHADKSNLVSIEQLEMIIGFPPVSFVIDFEKQADIIPVDFQARSRQ